MLTEDNYTRAVDWWGMGVLIFEMLVGESPFPGEIEEVLDSIVNDDVHYPGCLSPDSISITQKTINWDALLTRKCKPPFLTKIKESVDVSKFDSEFTTLQPTLPPPPVSCSLSPEQQDAFTD
uniref:Protein kinase domain-containing protein n=1 Tax=Hucho hucho TaxID=62062 RepID=A0A4W5R1Z3_9TELE